MNDLQFTTNQSLDIFLKSMNGVDTDVILSDPDISKLINGIKPKNLNPKLDIYEILESFLILFEERENYEMCYRLVSNWPKLKRNKNGV